MARPRKKNKAQKAQKAVEAPIFDSVEKVDGAPSALQARPEQKVQRTVEAHAVVRTL